MSLALVRAALETALAAMSPALDTAWENASFQPTQGTAYQAVNLLPNTPLDLEMTGSLFWEQGIFQVRLHYPLGAGPADSFARAASLQDTFRRGASFTSGAVTVRIINTPAIGPAFTDEDRFVVPVSIPYFARIIRS